MSLNINDLDLFIFDIEGVLVDNIDQPTPYMDALEFFTFLKKKKKTIIFLSNVGRKSQRQIAEMLNQVGYDIEQKFVFTAGAIAAIYFKRNFKNKRIFLISEGGVYEDFIAAGLNVVNNSPVDFVVVAADRNLTYQKLNFAMRMLLKGAKLVSVGGGMTFEGVHLGDKGIFLGEDAFTFMLSKVTNVEPLCIGKPHKIVYDQILAVFKKSRDKTVMIGDKIETDVLGAKTANIKSILIDRNRYSKKILSKLSANKKPDLIASNMLELKY